MVAADPNGDFDLIDNLEPITLRAGASEVGLAIPRAKRRSITTQELAASGGRYLSGDTRWHIKAADAPVPPLPGWQVIDGAGTIWTALVVERATWDHRWKLVCRNLAVAHGLDDVIRIQIAERHEKGDGGDEMPIWADWKTGVLARIQPDRIDRAMQGSLHSESAMFTVLLGESVDFVLDISAYRVIGNDGRVFQIDGVDRFEQIDFLPQLSVSEIDPFTAP